jgi:hypothetical protein
MIRRHADASGFWRIGKSLAHRQCARMREPGGGAHAGKRDRESGAGDAGRDERALKAPEAFAQPGARRGKAVGRQTARQPVRGIPVAVPDAFLKPAQNVVFVSRSNCYWDCCCFR